MASPSPAPSVRAAPADVLRVNRSNSWGTNSAGTPWPWSSTRSRKCLSRCSAEISIGAAPYRVAFTIRFETMRSNAFGSLGRHEPDKLMYPDEHVQRLRLDADPVRL